MSNRAWVTLATNDSYGLGALVLAHSLRRVGSSYPAVVLLTPAVTEAMRDRLRGVFAEVVLVDVLDSRDAAHLALLQRPELGITFTKIHCWTLTQYEKCVFLDADTLVVQNCDELFDHEELSAAPDVGWPDCFNSGVFVYKPSNETFEALVRFAQERGSFDGGDQGLLNSYFSEWARGDPSKRLPFLYNVTSAAFYSYIPALKQFGQNMKIIHFIGANKPWLQTFNWETRSVSAPDHLRELLQLWWDLFASQVHSHLDTSMENAPQDLPPDRAHYYEPQVDPDSQFPWHRPETRVSQPSQHEQYVEKCLAEFFDPWKNYKGNVPPKSDESNVEEQRTLTVGRVEVSQEIRDFAWEYRPRQNFETSPSDSGHKNVENFQNFSQPSHISTDSTHHQVYPTHQEFDSHREHHSHQTSQSCQTHSQSIPNDTSHNHHTHDWEFQSPDQVSYHRCNDPQQQHQDFIQYHEHYHYHSHQEQPNAQSYLNTDSVPHFQFSNDNVKETDFSYQKEYFNHNHSHIQKFEEGHHVNQSQHTDTPHSKLNSDQIKFNETPKNNSSEGEEKVIEDERIEETQGVSVNGENTVCESDAGEPEIRPRHPYDYFWLRHRVTIDSRGRKICTHELPPTPPPSPPPESPTRSVLDSSDEQSGVAGNLARVSPDNIGSQSEVLDELTRRQGWEAGNIDYMGADSFANIWAKISQTLSQPRSSPPKQATPPPKEPTPPKQPTPRKDLTSSSEVESIQPERTEQSALTPIQKEADSPAPAPVAETVVHAISELETALKDEYKINTESSIIDPAKPEDKLAPEAIKSPVTETVVQAISELETALKDEPKVSTKSSIIDPAKPEDKLEPEAIKPALESKVESDIKKETVAVEPEVTKADVIALDFPPGSGSEIIPEKLIAAETISKSLAEPTPSADHQPENATKPESDIVQRESSAADESVSVSETSEPSKITPIPLKSLADTKLEQAKSDSTQVAQLKGESSLQSVEDAAEISQAKAPVGSLADTEISQAEEPVESPTDTEISQVKALVGSPADTKTSQVKATVRSSADTTVSQVKAPVESPADIPLSPAPATETSAVISADIEVSSTRETPVTTEVSDTVVTSAKEISASTEIPAKTETSTTTDIPALKKSSTIIDQVPATTGPTVTEAPVMVETSAATEALTPKEATTTTEVPAKSETLPTDVVTTTETPPAADVSTTLEGSVETETSVKLEVLTTTEALASIPAVADIPTELPAAKEAPVKVAKSVEGSTCSVPDETKKAPSTPDKSLELSKDSASDSPPLATTPAKEEQPPTAVKSGAGAEGDKERAARRPAQRLQLVPPAAAAAPPTPDSELEDAAALAQSIIASELATPTVTAPTPPLPTPASPPAPPVSLAQIGVKPTAKEKTTTAAHIASSVSETKDISATKKKSEKPGPAKPEQHDAPSEQPTPSSPTDTTEPAAAIPKEKPVKKTVIKKVKKEGSTAETPVPPPRKKEKKPK